MILCRSKQSLNLTWHTIDSSGHESLLDTSMSKYTLIELFLQQNSLYQTELIINTLNLTDFVTYSCVNSLNQSSRVNLTLSTNSACVIPVCICLNVTWVNCSQRGLANLDEYLFTASPSLIAQVVWLDLSHNQLVYLNSEMFKKFVNLAFLDLSFNDISAIDANAFDFLSNLNVSLDLSYNQLDAIYSQTFTGLSSLTSFYLRSNKVKIIEDNSFLSLTKLKLLDLSLNKLTAVKALTLNGLESLQIISLQSNQISSFDVNALSNLANLRELNLHDNAFGVTNYIASCLGKHFYFQIKIYFFLLIDLE